MISRWCKPADRERNDVNPGRVEFGGAAVCPAEYKHSGVSAASRLIFNPVGVGIFVAYPRVSPEAIQIEALADFSRFWLPLEHAG
jgi:hypothetical protein